MAKPLDDRAFNITGDRVRRQAHPPKLGIEQCFTVLTEILVETGNSQSLPHFLSFGLARRPSLC